MSTKYNRKIQAIVIHHMGDGLSPNVSILKRWNPYNYDYPEYDFGVEFDGTIREGRLLNYQGSHCVSDKPPYNQKGYQWWNRNSIGIGLAGDFTKYPMPQAQFNTLVTLVKKLMKQYNLTLDNVYPHGQVCYTDCPGCTYSKVPVLKGYWSYDEFENAVRNNTSTKEEVKTMKNLVTYKYEADSHASFYLASYLQCIYIPYELLTQEIIDSCENIYQVGGTKLNDKFKVISGNDKYDSIITVLKHIGKIK